MRYGNKVHVNLKVHIACQLEGAYCMSTWRFILHVNLKVHIACQLEGAYCMSAWTSANLAVLDVFLAFKGDIWEQHWSKLAVPPNRTICQHLGKCAISPIVMACPFLCVCLLLSWWQVVSRQTQKNQENDVYRFWYLPSNCKSYNCTPWSWKTFSRWNIFLLNTLF